MTTENLITQTGIIVSIKGNLLKIAINCSTPCSSCHAKSACTSMDSSEKIIEVNTTKSLEFKVGEKVNITMPLKMGYLALFYGILLPFIIIMVALLVGNRILLNDITSGIISLTLLLVYYGLLFINQAKLKRKFFFKVEKII